MTAPGSERQRRTQDVPAPPPAPRLVSDEQMQYLDLVPKLQQQAATDPYYNGGDTKRRLHGDD